MSHISHPGCSCAFGPYTRVHSPVHACAIPGTDRARARRAAGHRSLSLRGWPRSRAGHVSGESRIEGLGLRAEG
eukprot:1102520-Rhodomonas_salina.1